MRPSAGHGPFGGNADKLAIFGLLDQLSDAAALGDVKAVKFLRDSLISCVRPAVTALCTTQSRTYFTSAASGCASCSTERLPNR